ncbi:hypothetical protein [Roseibium aquae]|uniref:hypothetical protein n=1 Tax=Roseibium aquae TaxID=1323746 RepID=UPI00123DF772|nr:hypothetical protein [Roseibium aquae]
MSDLIPVLTATGIATVLVLFTATDLVFAERLVLAGLIALLFGMGTLTLHLAKRAGSLVFPTEPRRSLPAVRASRQAPTEQTL